MGLTNDIHHRIVAAWHNSRREAERCLAERGVFRESHGAERCVEAEHAQPDPYPVPAQRIQRTSRAAVAASLSAPG